MASCGLAVLLIAGVALATPPEATHAPVRIEIDGTPPFTAEELAKALTARLPADGPRGVLRVVARPDGSIELSWQSRRRVVDVGGDTGPAAARVAALLAADLLLPLGLPAYSLDSQGPSVRPPSVATENTLRLAADYQLWSGALAGPLLHGAELVAGLDGRRLRLRASAGYLSGEGNSQVDLTAWPLRLGVGAGVTFGALLGNLVMVPYQMDGLVHVTRALVGLGLEAQAHIPLLAGFSAEVCAGFEVYVNRRAEVWAGSYPMFAMPTSAFRFALGLSWRRPR